MIAAENQKAAQIFLEIADYLEIQGENPFKVRAYQKAARAINGVEKPLSTLRDSGELRNIPGIGKAIADKIEQLLDQGRVELHQKLSAQVPSSLLDLIQIPGLGAKKASMLYKELGIDSVEKLKEAIEAGSLRELKGFGKKTEERLLDGLNRMGTTDQRMPFGKADKIARAFLESLGELAAVRRIEVAGSYRRRRDTVGDLDLLVEGTDAESVMEAFCGGPWTESVILRGDTKSSIRLADGFQVDLRVVPGESFGAALQYFTGSKDHNIKVRARAEKKGWKLNEYGLYSESGEQLAGADESGIYEALGLPCFPPELRESGAELELPLPQLVRLEDVRGNLHTHTDWSDGIHTLEQMVAEAGRLQYEYLAVTDHSRALVIGNGLTEERLLAQGEALKALDSGEVKVLWASECDIMPDASMDFSDELLQRLDLVVGAIHSSFHLGKERMTKRILAAVHNPHVDIIAHPSGRKLGKRPGYEVDWEAVFEACLATGTALEINASPSRLDLPDTLVKRAASMGVLFSVATDAHSKAELSNMRFGIGVARRGWLTPEQVINCWSREKLLTWLSKEKSCKVKS